VPSAAKHIRWTRANEEFSQRTRDVNLNSVGRRATDWAITAVYYAAVHCIESVLRQSPDIEPDEVLGWKQRERLTRDHPDLGSRISGALRALREMSEDARYNCKTFEDPKVDDALDHFFSIKGAINRILSRNGQRI